jgi:fructosamine-3-kinase
MFEAEAEGLRALAKGPLRVPLPLCFGVTQNRAWLVLEYLPMGSATPEGSAKAGQQLAQLHGLTAQSFGWLRDNYIGTTPQLNAWHQDWPTFWRQRRLEPQLDRLARMGLTAGLQETERLLDALPRLLDHQPQPSLLHGDLWVGNLAYGPDGEPLVFDPAVYYGDRETDLAMTELFGGFDRTFYQAYQDSWPLAPGYERRKKLYNLYHILNHANLFGKGYLGQAQRMIRELLAT